IQKNGSDQIEALVLQVNKILEAPTFVEKLCPVPVDTPNARSVPSVPVQARLHVAPIGRTRLREPTIHNVQKPVVPAGLSQGEGEHVDAVIGVEHPLTADEVLKGRHRGRTHAALTHWDAKVAKRAPDCAVGHSQACHGPDRLADLLQDSDQYGAV